MSRIADQQFISPIPSLRESMSFHGFAVVSADGFIASEPGELSFTWSSGIDKTHLLKALDDARLCVMGRKTHELYENVSGRRRLVLSRAHGSLETDGKDENALFINRDHFCAQNFMQVMTQQARGSSENGLPVCVLGGAEVFEHFLRDAQLGFDAFDLSVELGVKHMHGLPCFPGTNGDGYLGVLNTLLAHGLRIRRETADNSTIIFQLERDRQTDFASFQFG